MTEPSARDISDRVAAEDWPALAAELNEHGSALTGRLLTDGECRAVASRGSCAQ